MNRIDRLTAILIQLQSKKVVKAQEIAKRFDISLRTVYRDLKALEQAGVPLGAEAGLGYFILEGYNLPPVKFSKEEAGALLMAAKLAEQQSDKSIKKNLENALYKIRSALKMEERDYLESIEDNIEVISLPNPTSETHFPDHFLTDLQIALSQNRVVNFDYYSGYNQSQSNRDVEPLSLCYYSRHWHLIGYCRLREALRDFRSDRIVKLHLKEQVFDVSRHQYSSYLDLLVRGSDLQEVTIKVTAELSRYISEQKYLMGFINSQWLDGGELMKFMSGDLQSFAHWLLQFSDQVSVVAPDSLKQRVVSLIEKAYRHYR